MFVWLTHCWRVCVPECVCWSALSTQTHTQSHWQHTELLEVSERQAQRHTEHTCRQHAVVQGAPQLAVLAHIPVKGRDRQHVWKG